MKELIRFFIKRLRFLMFIALEIIAFIFIFHTNDFQKSVYLRDMASISGNTYQVTTSIADYFRLKSTNAELSSENNRLRNELELLLHEKECRKIDSISPVCNNINIRYINAKVVYSSIYKLQNFIVIDRGINDGIEADMGVVSNNAVVGVVQYATEHYAVVLPLINIKQRLSAKIEKDNQLGTITWNGVNAKSVQMEEIPRHATPEIGDTVVTSGYSAIFPEGYLIGTIAQEECSPGSTFFEIDIDLATNFSTLTYVSESAFAVRIS